MTFETILAVGEIFYNLGPEKIEETIENLFPNRKEELFDCILNYIMFPFTAFSIFLSRNSSIKEFVKISKYEKLIKHPKEVDTIIREVFKELKKTNKLTRIIEEVSSKLVFSYPVHIESVNIREYVDY